MQSTIKVEPWLEDSDEWLEERDVDIRVLYRNMSELNSLSHQLALLVDQQEPAIQTIALSIEDTSAQVTETQKTIEKASHKIRGGLFCCIPI